MKVYPTNPGLVLDHNATTASVPPAAAREAFQGMKSTDRAPREEIQHLAYAIWQKEGMPQYCDLAHWLQAEREVMRSA